MRDQPPIVVAVPDGDDEALLRFAAWEALIHGSSVHLMHVDTGQELVAAERVLADAVARTEILTGPGVMVTGEVIARNGALDGSAELINTDPYGEGWLFKVRVAAEDPTSGLLSAQDYQAITAQ